MRFVINILPISPTSVIVSTVVMEIVIVTQIILTRMIIIAIHTSDDHFRRWVKLYIG
jgi:hypothetical protein